jgi:hypothetical protein
MINSNFGFTPLKEVWLGDCYPKEYYNHLPNEIADPFREITEITKSDTNRLQKFLEDRGIVVRRPVFNRIEDYLTKHDMLVKPPICPRDDYFVLGKTLYSLRNWMPHNAWKEWLNYYSNQGLDVRYGENTAVDYVTPPSVVRMGQDLYIDEISHNDSWHRVCEWLISMSKTHRVNISNTFGHCDAIFCPVAKGLIVTSHWKSDYTHTFPGWEVFHVPYESKGEPTFGWHVNNTVDSNRAFNEHIVKEAQNWVGDYRETVFEVNMLVLDEHNVISMKSYEPLDRWLEERGITNHHFPMRTDQFWDGGWHCLTLDISRVDTQKDLFPDRGPNGVYWRIE